MTIALLLDLVRRAARRHRRGLRDLGALLRLAGRAHRDQDDWRQRQPDRGQPARSSSRAPWRTSTSATAEPGPCCVDNGITDERDGPPGRAADGARGRLRSSPASVLHGPVTATRYDWRMGQMSAALELPYPADRVCRVATRVPDIPRWLPEVVDAELLDPDLAVGSRIQLQLGPGAAGAEITGTVIELRPPEQLSISGAGGPLTVKVRVHLDAEGPSLTRISLEIDLARRHSSGSSPRRRSGGSRQSCRRRWPVSGRCWMPSRRRAGLSADGARSAGSRRR